MQASGRRRAPGTTRPNPTVICYLPAKMMQAPAHYATVKGALKGFTEEVARVASFLASDANSFMNRATIVVDGAV